MNNMQPLSQPPPMVRMANGQLMPAAQKTDPNKLKARKLLIVVGYWEGDKEQAEELCHLIADLERVKNRDADILLFARSDATEPSRDVRAKLEAKFERVLFERCRRKDGKGWPFGCNSMFYDMVTLFGQVQPWPSNYYAFVNLEADVVPTRPGWIHEIIKAWREADGEGRACVGFVHDDPKRHLNGVAVYAIDMYQRVGSNKLAGGSPQIPYDIRHADSILPLAVDSPLFYFEFRKETISAEELFEERRGITPALFHGVKDGSARAAVRARHITFTEQREVTRQSVITYFEPSEHTSTAEAQDLLNAWREGWKSRGWNPVVISSRDGVKHPRWNDILEHVKKLPFTGPLAAHVNRFMRWVAFARVGGGLMVDYDLIPGDFTPSDLENDAFAIIDDKTGKLVGLRLSRAQCAEWLNIIAGYDAQPGDVVEGQPCVTDREVWEAAIETVGAGMSLLATAGATGRSERLVHFSASAVGAATRKSVAVDSFLRAKV